MEWIHAAIALVAVALAALGVGHWSGKRKRKPPAKPVEPTKPVLVDDPVATIEEDVNDAHDDIDATPADELGDLWAEHAASADD